jgi:hypothetical protein
LEKARCVECCPSKSKSCRKASEKNVDYLRNRAINPLPILLIPHAAAASGSFDMLEDDNDFENEDPESEIQLNS